MEPAPAAIFSRTVVTGVLLTAVLASSACQRDADVPAKTSAREPVSADRHASDATLAVEIGTDSPADEAAVIEKAQERNPPASPDALQEAGGEPGRESSATDRGRLEPQLAVPVKQSAGQHPPDQEQGPATQTEPSTGSGLGPRDTPLAEEQAPKEPERASPLVDDSQGLERLHPFYPVWIDRQRTHVVMVGRICKRRAPLELFACLKHSKEHESVVVVDTEAYVVHAGLLAVHAEPGSPVQFVPEFSPPQGTKIEVTVVWEDAEGRRRRARAQDWVRDVGNLYTMFEGVVANQFDEELNVEDQVAAWKAMEHPWVFAGSLFVKDERTGQTYYQADAEGDLICVSNFPSAVLDVPIRSSDSNAALLFEAFTERIPPLGTPVTLILTPKLGKPGGDVTPPD